MQEGLILGLGTPCPGTRLNAIREACRLTPDERSEDTSVQLATMATICSRNHPKNRNMRSLRVV